jgi:Fe-S cluster assembly ATP-binding protein
MINKKLLSIFDLCVSFGGKFVINKLKLNVSFGETHVIMGPNGVGKSTLARVLAGDYYNYNTSGSVFFFEKDLFSLSQSDIALNGLFLSFQNPIEIPGVSNFEFFKSFLNYKRKYNNIPPIENADFLDEVRSYMSSLDMKEELLNRYVNVDFSGGEKKKNEILQMLLLKPKLAILDEIDSGLDIDALTNVFKCIKSYRSIDNSLIIITHYSRIVNYIDIDFVHVMNNGTIVKTGGKDLIYEIDKNGYSSFN